MLLSLQHVKIDQFNSYAKGKYLETLASSNSQTAKQKAADLIGAEADYAYAKELEQEGLALEKKIG